jgi:hypothetical protein
VQKDQGEGAKLTEGLWRLELRRKVEVDDDWRRRRSGSRGCVVAGLLLAGGSSKLSHAGPKKMPRGLRGRESHRRRAIEVAKAITNAQARLDSRRSRRSRLNCQLGEVLDDEADLLRGLAGAGLQRGGRSTVRQRRLRGGGKKEAAALRVSRGAAVARFRVLGCGTFL